MQLALKTPPGKDLLAALLDKTAKQAGRAKDAKEALKYCGRLELITELKSIVEN